MPPPHLPAYTVRNEPASGLVNKCVVRAGEVCRCDGVVCGAVAIERHTMSAPTGCVANVGSAVVGSPSGPPELQRLGAAAPTCIGVGDVRV